MSSKDGRMAIFTLRPQEKERTREGVERFVPVKPGAGMLPAIARFQAVPARPSPQAPRFDQAAGHSNVFKQDGLDPSRLEKALDERERSFYELANKGYWPAEFLPEYHGVGLNGDTVVLENLTYGMEAPCVADLKMGIRSVEESADWIKKLRMRFLDDATRTSETGVRLEGLSMHRTLDKVKIKGTKGRSHLCSIGCSLDEILAFFLTDRKGVRVDVARELLARVEEILDYFEHRNSRYTFIGSSILFVYDNNNVKPRLRWARALEHAGLPRWHVAKFTTTKVKVRMIDFAHYREMEEGQDRDGGYISGLRSLQTALQDILDKHAREPRFEFTDVVKSAMSADMEALEVDDLLSSSDDDPDLIAEEAGANSDASFSRLVRKATLRLRDAGT